MRDNSDISATGAESDDDATRKFGDGSTDTLNWTLDEGVMYEDLDFGPSDDEIRATLQPGKRGTRKLRFSTVFGENALGAEGGGGIGSSPDANPADEFTTKAFGDSGVNPNRTPTLGPLDDLAVSRIYIPEECPDWEVAPEREGLPGQDETLEQGGLPGQGTFPNQNEEKEQENDGRTSRMGVKPASKAPRYIAAAVAVLAIAAVAVVFFLGGFGPGYWTEHTELGTVDFQDWRTGNPVRPSEELVFEKGDKREYFAPNVAGYQAVEARANDKRLKLARAGEGGGSGSGSGKSDANGGGHANIIEGLSPWPEGQKSQITVLYAKEVEYTVSYVEAETNAELAPTKVVATNVSGDEVTENAISIEGYEPVSDAEFKLTLLDDDEKNTITFEYREAKAEDASSASGSQDAANQATTGKSGEKRSSGLKKQANSKSNTASSSADDDAAADPASEASSGSSDEQPSSDSESGSAGLSGGESEGSVEGGSAEGGSAEGGSADSSTGDASGYSDEGTPDAATGDSAGSPQGDLPSDSGASTETNTQAQVAEANTQAQATETNNQAQTVETNTQAKAKGSSAGDSADSSSASARQTT